MEFLLEDANTHLEHLEDDIILNGAKGGENALNFLDALRDMLQGSSNKKVNLTVKWDGAPAKLLESIHQMVSSLLQQKVYSIKHQRLIIHQQIFKEITQAKLQTF